MASTPLSLEQVLAIDGETAESYAVWMEDYGVVVLVGHLTPEQARARIPRGREIAAGSLEHLFARWDRHEADCVEPDVGDDLGDGVILEEDDDPDCACQEQEYWAHLTWQVPDTEATPVTTLVHTGRGAPVPPVRGNRRAARHQAGLPGVPAGSMAASDRMHRMTVGDLRELLADVPDWALVEVDVPEPGQDFYTATAVEQVDYRQGVFTVTPVAEDRDVDWDDGDEDESPSSSGTAGRAA